MGELTRLNRPTTDSPEYSKKSPKINKSDNNNTVVNNNEGGKKIKFHVFQPLNLKFTANNNDSGDGMNGGNSSGNKPAQINEKGCFLVVLFKIL